MFKPWITIPTDKVNVQFPMSMEDRDIRVMFRDVETIDNIVDQLQNLRQLISEQDELRKILRKQGDR